MAGADKLIPPVWTTGWTDILTTGTWRAATPVHLRRPASCQVVCPLSGDIPVWIQLAGKKDYHRSWLELVANNPLPAVTGRICHHPCEASCNRGQYDQPVAINALEQFIGDLALAEKWELPGPSTEKAGRVAVVGGGPCGLACAYRLRLRGHAVTIFESYPELGGMLRYGIPEYRLPKRIVRAEIDRLLALGVDVKVGKMVSREDLSNLAQQFDAVFLAPGAQRAKKLPQIPADNPNVYYGLTFLSQLNAGNPPSLGLRTVVVGGGSVAMDVARTACRLSSEVQIVALEGRESLPANAEEVEEAQEEGITISCSTMVSRVSFTGTRFDLDCCQVALKPSGSAEETLPLPGTDFSLPAENLIVAVGQEPEIADWDIALDEEGCLLVDDRTVTGSKGFFAGGDATSTVRKAALAMGQGLRIADRIADGLEGDSPAYLRTGVSEDYVPYKDINTFYFSPTPREERKKPPGSQDQFAEVRTVYSAFQADIEAGRCFGCGYCIECDNCYYFCPDMAVKRSLTVPEHYEVSEQYCKGCGCCVEECPRGAVVLREEKK